MYDSYMYSIHLAQPKSDVEFKERTDDGEENIVDKFIHVMNRLLATGELIRPKILFTPNNSLTRRIIKRVSC